MEFYMPPLLHLLGLSVQLFQVIRIFACLTERTKTNKDLGINGEIFMKFFCRENLVALMQPVCQL